MSASFVRAAGEKQNNVVSMKLGESNQKYRLMYIIRKMKIATT
jgi:hypothetical protein